MQSRFAEQFRLLRRQSGYTQEEIAHALDVTPQAVSRWENAACCPDIFLLPAIADYFGVTVDSLFGSRAERERRVNALCEKLRAMNAENNGTDVSMDAAIQAAREGLDEFPGNEKLLLALADLLNNAGYVRHGEHHMEDAEGYDEYDTARHKAYPEWQEAISLYEKLLERLAPGEARWAAVQALGNLYAVTGARKKAAALARDMPRMTMSREFLALNAVTGRERAEASRQLEAQLTCCLADRMAQRIIGECQPPKAAARRVREILQVYAIVCGGEGGEDAAVHAHLAHIHLFLADRLWNAGEEAAAFEALDAALAHARHCPGLPRELTLDYPWWCVAQSRAENIREDPRWLAWADQTRQAAK